jgi:hypothetical protein
VLLREVRVSHAKIVNDEQEVSFHDDDAPAKIELLSEIDYIRQR